MTKAEESAQCTGFDATAGNVGYLREAYHGGPYVTKYLVAEAFDGGSAAIAAATLRERLPTAVLMHLYREHRLYGGGKDPGRIDLDELPNALQAVFTQEVGDETHEDFAAALKPESIETAEGLIAERMLPATALSFVDFVALCERMERETGEACTIVASY
ncbi:hypothetical protein [Hyphomicrobium denitrificans]|nr:hypothetical protein [Hyphomicrobium denitrificans]